MLKKGIVKILPPACQRPEIAHGQVSPTGDIKDGTPVTVSCDGGYVLEGSATITCMGGSFTGMPTCKKGNLTNI